MQLIFRNCVVSVPLLTIVMLVLSPGFSQATPIAHLVLDARPGDFVGPGSGHFDITYTPLNSAFFSAQIRRTIGAAPAQPAELLFFMGTVTSGPDNTFVLLFFGTDQLGIPIQPGFYPNAQRADFAAPGHPGLDIAFQNNGSNGVSGQFSVDAVTFSSDLSTILTFAAHFQQFAERAYTGSFTYNATAVPGPTALFLLVTGISIIFLVRKCREPGEGRAVEQHNTLGEVLAILPGLQGICGRRDEYTLSCAPPSQSAEERLDFRSHRLCRRLLDQGA